MSAEVYQTLLFMLWGVGAVLWISGCHHPSSSPSSPPATTATPLPPEVEYDPATAAQKYLERKKRP